MAKDTARPRGRGGRIALLVIAVLLVLLCAAPFLYNFFTPAYYEDVEARARGWEELFTLYPGDGAHLKFHMDQGGVYRLIADHGLDAVAEESGGRVRVEEIAYSLSPESGALEVFARVKLFGFLPAPLRVTAQLSFPDNDTLFILPREVWYGNHIRIAPEKLAKWTGIDALRDGLSLPLEEYTGPLQAEDVYLEGMGFTIVSPLLTNVLDDVAAQKEPTAQLYWLYSGGDAAGGALFGTGRAEFLRAAGASMDALRAALRDVTAYAGDACRRALTERLSALPFDLTSAMAESPALREAQARFVADAQASYRASQRSLREAYWYKNVTLTKACLLGKDGLPLEHALPADWEARVVLAFNENYDAIVKTSEGNPRLQVPIPGLPHLSELPRDSADALQRQYGDGPFDLTLALRLPSGAPALVFLTAEDDFGLALLSEAQFAELRESEVLPIRSAAELITAPRDTWLRLPGAGEEDPDGYYIGLN